MKKHIFLTSFLCVCYQMFGIIYTPDFKNITIENGLSNNTVRCITKDANGFVWFGTYDGLCRYDGLSIKTYRRTSNSNEDAPVHNSISTLFSDSRNQLFVGTRKGLCLYVGSKETFLPLSYTEFGSGKLKPCDAEVVGIVEDNRHNLFVSTLRQGLLKYNAAINSFEQVELINKAHNLTVNGITLVDDTDLYLSINNHGIYKYNIRNKKLTLITEKVKYAICQKHINGLLYIGTNDGLYVYNLKTNMLSIFSNSDDLKSPIQFLQEDKNDVLWIGTESKGITLLDLKTNTTQHIPAGYSKSLLSSEGVYSMYIDNKNSYWIGTMRGGVEVWNSGKKDFFSKRNMSATSPAANFVTSFAEISPGIFWLGSDGAGIQQYNLNTDAFEKNEALSRINSIAGKAVISMRKDKVGNVWLATYGKGLVCYNIHTKQIEQYTRENSSLTSNRIWSLYIDNKDNLWIGAISGGGLFKFDYTKKVVQRKSVNEINVTNITESKKGKLLFVTYENIGIYDPVSKKTKLFSTDMVIQNIYEDKKGTIWIGTERNGILKLNLETGKLTPASDKLDYLNKTIIMAIVEDDYSNLWISTTNGLYRFHYPTEMLTTYNKEDGLQSQQFNYSSVYKTQNNLLFFGGINGFSFFNPKDISVQTEDLPLHIIDFYIHNKSVFADREIFSDVIDMLSNKDITIKYRDAYFRFDFTAIYFNNPEKIQYAYMLEGLDKGWNYTGSNRSANYSGLSQGDYVFKVKYATQPGQWNTKLLEIKIHVLPPFYLTWWAFLFYFAVISFIINKAIQIQRKQNKLKQDLLLADLKEEQVKQVQLMREQFFINISHELRTPLTLIIPPIKDSLSSNPYTPLDQNELQSVYNNANRLLLLINKLLLFRKNEMGKSQLRLSHSDLVDFAGKIYENFTQIARKRNVIYAFNAPKEPILFWFDIDKMEIILYNLLSNAFKFTPEYGKIELEIRKESETTLVVGVRDNGCGISEAELSLIFNRYHSSNKFSGIGIGLSLVKDYAESLHGTLHIEAAHNKGSHFYINFDLNASYEQSEMNTDKPKVYLPSKDMVELVEIDTLLYLNQNKDENADTLDSKLPKVLVVEDNKEILEYIKKILTETKMYDILEATNGKSALKIARKVLPDIIISDVHMPEMNGLELCKAIKENTETNHIYFIIITADLLESTENKGLIFGADEYITKPFDKSKLLNKITTIFNYQQKLRKYFDNKIILGNPEANPEASTINTDFIDKCITLVKENYRSDEFNTQILAQQTNMSQSALYKKIKLCTGKSINEFIRTVKLSIATELIMEGKLNITEIAYEVGINDPKYFRECFKKQYGVTPSEYKNKTTEN